MKTEGYRLAFIWSKMLNFEPQKILVLAECPVHSEQNGVISSVVACSVTELCTLEIMFIVELNHTFYDKIVYVILFRLQ